MWRRAGWLILLLTACGSDNADNIALPPPSSPPPLQTEVAFPNLTFSAPVLITNAGDGSGRLFVVEQAGRIWVFPNNTAVAAATLFLDISDRVLLDGEQGLLGLAFDPDYETNGYFYVYYSVENPHVSRIARYQVSADPNVANVTSEDVILEFEQPDFSNHKAGALAFGPDGMLYVASGDGGSGNDPDGNAQNLGVLLGKMLRINPDPNNVIPPDNPFVGQPGARGEIWAYGLRNPFRMSFDRATGRLWAGDVGQGAREEIDIIVMGGNYGWRTLEGTLFTGLDPMPASTDYFVFPVIEYGRSVGTTVIGDYVYHGSGLPDYDGIYVYADFGSGRIWALVHNANTGAVVSNSEIANLSLITSFGEDEAGELYVTRFADGKIYRFRQM